MFTDAVYTGRQLSKNARPQNVVYSGILAATVAYIRHVSIVQCALCYGLMLCVYAVAASLNNKADVHTDRLNKRTDNPLASSQLSPRVLSVFILIALCGAIALQPFLVQPYTAIITLAYAVLLFAYSDRRLNIQSRGLWGTLLLCLCYGALPLLLGMYQKAQGITVWLLIISLWMMLATLPIILAKDYKDYSGDKRTGKLTPLVRYGATKVRIIAYSALTLTVVTYLLFAIAYSVRLLPAVLLALIYSLLTIVLHQRRGEPSKVCKTTLLLVLIGMVVLLVHSSKI